MPNEKSDGNLPERLLVGSSSAAGELDQRYRGRLCSLVERELGQRFRRRLDPEDVVQSTLRSFFQGVKKGEFRIDHSAALWRLLEEMTLIRVQRRIEKETAARRNPNAEAYDQTQIMRGTEPTPAEAAMVADLIEANLAGLNSPYPEILRLRLEGHTESQIAQTLRCGRQAVHYRLERIRERMNELLRDDSIS